MGGLWVIMPIADVGLQWYNLLEQPFLRVQEVAMVATLIAFALLGEIQRAPDNRQAYDDKVKLIYHTALFEPIKKREIAERAWKQSKATNGSKSPQAKAARKRLDLAIDTVRLTKIEWRNWPPPI